MTRGGIPGICSERKNESLVELIEITIRDWADVDHLEEYLRIYDRVLTDFRLPDGSTVQAWSYTMNHVLHCRNYLSCVLQCPCLAVVGEWIMTTHSLGKR